MDGTIAWPAPESASLSPRTIHAASTRLDNCSGSRRSEAVGERVHPVVQTSIALPAVAGRNWTRRGAISVSESWTPSRLRTVACRSMRSAVSTTSPLLEWMPPETSW